MHERVAICVPADENYFPAAVHVAWRVRELVPDRSVDVLVATSSQRMIEAARRYADRIAFLYLDGSKLDAVLTDPRTHVTRATFLKMLVPEALAGRHRQVLVLDTDIAVLDAAIGRIARLDLGDDALAAVLDVSFFIDEDEVHGPHWTYRERLGLPSAETAYFNAGVMLIDVDRWLAQELGPRAIDYAVRHPERCTYQDQSALNAVVRGRWLPLSPRWNFAALYESRWYADLVRPSILHFLGPIKPWHDLRFPGERRHCDDLRRFLRDSPWPHFIESHRRPLDRMMRLGQLVRRRLPQLGRQPYLHPRKVDYLLSTRFADIEQGIGPPFVAGPRVAHP